MFYHFLLPAKQVNILVLKSEIAIENKIYFLNISLCRTLLGYEILSESCYPLYIITRYQTAIERLKEFGGEEHMWYCDIVV